jgi:hypothetical protein
MNKKITDFEKFSKEKQDAIIRLIMDIENLYSAEMLELNKNAPESKISMQCHEHTPSILFDFDSEKISYSIECPICQKTLYKKESSMLSIIKRCLEIACDETVSHLEKTLEKIKDK